MKEKIEFQDMHIFIEIIVNFFVDQLLEILKLMKLYKIIVKKKQNYIIIKILEKKMKKINLLMKVYLKMMIVKVFKFLNQKLKKLFLIKLLKKILKILVCILIKMKVLCFI